MSKRRSNKSVKRMICGYYNELYRASLPYFGAYFSRSGLNFISPGSIARAKQGTISLTASELKGE